MNLDASSKDIFKYITSSIGNINKKPLVGLGVVGTNTLIRFLPVFCAISPLFSFVAKPTAQTPFLGYSIKTTLLFPLSFLGKRILKLIDDLFKRIPVLRTIYSAIVQMTETFSNKDDSGKKSVVLIEYPRKGVWAVGFATKENKSEMVEKTNKKLINVFVPTTPNPTSGFLLMFPIDEVIYLNMTFEEASKFIVSAGTSTGKN